MRNKSLIIGTFFLSLFLTIGSIAIAKKYPKETIPITIKKISTYVKPDYPPGTSHLVRLEIVAYDNTYDQRIVNITLDKHLIPLRPSDPMGKRANIHFQLKPGNYTLRWKIRRDGFSWPRTQSFKKVVTLTKKNKWVYVRIDGNKAYITY